MTYKTSKLIYALLYVSCFVIQYHGGRSIANFLILQICELYQHLSRRVLHFQQLQNGGAIISNCYILQQKIVIYKLI